jgi:hypothetical protein
MIGAEIANLHKGDNQHSSIDGPSISQPAAAAMMNVSVPSITRAKKVIKDAIPALQEMVTSGEVAVSAAALAGTSRKSCGFSPRRDAASQDRREHVAV